ncbi:hypothetical protein [Pluralibacter gergoviae]|uniref:hypothetical protein n=1 Tax=Pluralibacter gergoviae TaxID=61647 RepID=UPI000ABD5705|nr:hypothetical protein [Pluralibacter gergoviae]
MMRISVSVYYEDTRSPDVTLCLDELFYVSELIDTLLEKKKKWYEKGYSRKKALEHVVFNHIKAGPEVVERWRKQLKKDYPLIIEGIWDGETDDKLCSINYIKKHIEDIKKTSLDIIITCNQSEIITSKVIKFLYSLVHNKKMLMHQ